MSVNNVPYYLENSLIGAQVSLKLKNDIKEEANTPKWKFLPLSLFNNRDEVGSMIDEEDSQENFPAEIKHEGDNNDDEKVNEPIKKETEDVQKCEETIPKKVGTYIPINPSNENTNYVHFSPFPTQWSRKEKATGLEVSQCGLSVTYVGETIHESSENNACSVRANCSIPPQCGIFYFEVTVIYLIGEK